MTAVSASAVSRMEARRPWGLIGVLILVVTSVVSWRQGVIFSGGVDPFVVGKAAVAVLAFAGAVAVRAVSPQRRRVGPTAVILVVLILGVSLLGAQVAGATAPALVLVVRIALLTATMVLLVSAYPSAEVLGALLTAMGLIAVIAAVTGVPSLVQSGRLDGGAPALAANELATVALPPAIGAVHAMARRGVGAAFGGAFVVLGGIVFLTGSRTALLVLGIGILLVFAITRPLSRGLVIGGLLILPFLYALIAFTDTASDVVSRGEDPAKLLTLNSRTFAWEAVLSTPKDSWAWWIGHGLQLKTIAVEGQYWTEQVLDSSWISAIAQSGIVGTVLLALLVVATLVFTIRRPGLRGLTIPLLAVIIVRSFLENGLLEASVTFTLVLTIALCTDPATPTEPVLRPAPGSGARGLAQPPRVLTLPAGWSGSARPSLARDPAR